MLTSLYSFLVMNIKRILETGPAVQIHRFSPMQSLFVCASPVLRVDGNAENMFFYTGLAGVFIHDCASMCYT